VTGIRLCWELCFGSNKHKILVFGSKVSMRMRGGRACRSGLCFSHNFFREFLKFLSLHQHPYTIHIVNVLTLLASLRKPQNPRFLSDCLLRFTKKPHASVKLRGLSGSSCQRRASITMRECVCPFLLRGFTIHSIALR
jgi:hypothetical protein